MGTLHAQIEKCKQFWATLLFVWRGGYSRHFKISFNFSSVFFPNCSAAFSNLSRRRASERSGAQRCSRTHTDARRTSLRLFQTLQFSDTPKRERAPCWETHRHAFIHTNTHRVSKAAACERAQRSTEILAYPHWHSPQTLRDDGKLQRAQRERLEELTANPEKYREMQRHSERLRTLIKTHQRNPIESGASRSCLDRLLKREQGQKRDASF